MMIDWMRNLNAAMVVLTCTACALPEFKGNLDTDSYTDSGTDTDSGTNSGTDTDSSYCELPDTRCLMIPATGQTKCYTDTDPLDSCAECAFHGLCGQDAQYVAEMPIARQFVFSHIGGDAIITDSLSGSQWLAAYPHDQPIYWDWADNYCSILEYATHDDWKLPSILDLAWILTHSKASFAESAIIPEVYDVGPHPGLDRLWSSTVDQYYTSEENRWTLGSSVPNFTRSSINTNSSLTFNCMRQTKGGELHHPDRYDEQTSNGAAIVHDQATGLVWQKIDWDTSPPAPSTLQNALAHCEDSSWGEIDDWRLPNINELLSITNYDVARPATSLPGFSSTEPNLFWSSTSSSHSPHSAMIVDFSSGLMDLTLKSTLASTLCVGGHSYSTLLE